MDKHHHEHEDELFLVVNGRLAMHFRDRVVHVEPEEFVIVPHGVEHKPAAGEETHALLFEPASTLNTGNVRNERTVEQPVRALSRGAASIRVPRHVALAEAHARRHL